MAGAIGGVNRAAIAALPKGVLNWRIWLLVVWAAHSGSFHGFQTANISGIMGMETFGKAFGFDRITKDNSSAWQGWIVSSMLLGQLVGALGSGPVSERWGRKSSMLLAAVWYSIGTILMTINFGSLPQVLIGRVAAGIGAGFGMTTGSIYIAEIAPSEVRGTMSTCFNVGIMSGVTGAYWINYGSLMHISDSSNWQWRCPMLLQIIPAIILFVGMPFAPEPPRFSAFVGRLDKAKSDLLFIRQLPEDHTYFVTEWTDLSNTVTAEKESEEREGTLKALWTLARFCIHDPSTRRRFVLVQVIQTFFIMSGGNSITYYAPTILSAIGLNKQDELLFSSIYGCFKVIGVAIYAFLLTERFGRRPLLMLGCALNFGSLLYLTCYLGIANVEQGASPGAAAWVAIVSICVFAVGYSIGWAPVFSLTTSEICPTRTRGPMVTAAITFQSLLNFAIARAFPSMTSSMGAYGPFALFTAFMFAAFIWTFLAFPECKGRNMETMDQVFDLPWWRVGWAQSRRGFPSPEIPIESKSENAGAEIVEKEYVRSP